MKCYNHYDRDAFAVCSSCGKGLCLECTEEYNGKMVCKNNENCKKKVCFTKNLLIIILLITALTAILAIID